jgi:hypothetical protein
MCDFDKHENVFFVIECTLYCAVSAVVCSFSAMLVVFPKVEKENCRKIFKHLFTFSLLIV